MWRMWRKRHMWRPTKQRKIFLTERWRRDNWDGKLFKHAGKALHGQGWNQPLRLYDKKTMMTGMSNGLWNHRGSLFHSAFISLSLGRHFSILIPCINSLANQLLFPRCCNSPAKDVPSSLSSLTLSFFFLLYRILSIGNLLHERKNKLCYLSYRQQKDGLWWEEKSVLMILEHYAEVVTIGQKFPNVCEQPLDPSLKTLFTWVTLSGCMFLSVRQCTRVFLLSS